MTVSDEYDDGAKQVNARMYPRPDAHSTSSHTDSGQPYRGHGGWQPMSGEVTYLADEATQTQTVAAQQTSILDYSPDDDTRFQLKNRVAKRDSTAGEPTDGTDRVVRRSQRWVGLTAGHTYRGSCPPSVCCTSPRMRARTRPW